MSISTDNVIRILMAGGNLTVDCKGKSTDNLIRIANTAVKLNKKITFINLLGKSTDNLIRIVKAGGDHLTIEIP